MLLLVGTALALATLRHQVGLSSSAPRWSNRAAGGQPPQLQRRNTQSLRAEDAAGQSDEAADAVLSHHAMWHSPGLHSVQLARMCQQHLDQLQQQADEAADTAAGAAADATPADPAPASGAMAAAGRAGAAPSDAHAGNDAALQAAVMGGAHSTDGKKELSCRPDEQPAVICPSDLDVDRNVAEQMLRVSCIACTCAGSAVVAAGLVMIRIIAVPIAVQACCQGKNGSIRDLNAGANSTTLAGSGDHYGDQYLAFCLAIKVSYGHLKLQLTNCTPPFKAVAQQSNKLQPS